LRSHDRLIGSVALEVAAVLAVSLERGGIDFAHAGALRPKSD
jgi:hypothetical protein